MPEVIVMQSVFYFFPLKSYFHLLCRFVVQKIPFLQDEAFDQLCIGKSYLSIIDAYKLIDGILA